MQGMCSHLRRVAGDRMVYDGGVADNVLDFVLLRGGRQPRRPFVDDGTIQSDGVLQVKVVVLTGPWMVCQLLSRPAASCMSGKGTYTTGFMERK